MENQWVLVLKEKDLSDNDTSIIGVASSRGKALSIIEDYYGNDCETSEFKDIRDSMVDFTVKVTVPGTFGGTYFLAALEFGIDDYE